MLVVIFAILDLLGLAGGGGSSSGGGGGFSGGGGGSSFSSSGSGSGGADAPDWVILLSLAGAIIFGLWPAKKVKQAHNARRSEQQRQAQARLSLAAAQDPMWNEADLKSYVEKVFLRYQADWQVFNTESIRTYTTENYAKHATLMLYALQQMGRQNVVKDIRIKQISVIGLHDDPDDSKDRVSIEFDAQARDVLSEVATGRVLFSRTVDFVEYWHFARVGNAWKLDSISQSTEAASMLHTDIQNFASKHDLFYSPDWGHLLLPERGQLFQHGFTGTDINNHTIGFWEGNLLVQLYTYSYTPNQNEQNYYLIGQITLPKSYGGIIVEQQPSLLGKRFRRPKGYNLVSFEWADFNKRFRVFATDENQVTSFELLQPAFMAWLYDQNLKVNFEVVDNVVYFYTPTNRSESRYPEMLEILQRSYKELRR